MVVVSDDLRGHLARRLAATGVRCGQPVNDQLIAYVELLARWNQKINLTALPLDPPSDDAIDRLLIEPLAAASRLQRGDRLAIDIGSGGGSPAIPIKIAAPALRMILVESRGKKASFLREVVRSLELLDVEVENHRLEDLAARGNLNDAADVLTLRAVTATHALWVSMNGLLRPGGRVFWFGGKLDSAETRLSSVIGASKPVVVRTPPNSQLLIFTKA